MRSPVFPYKAAPVQAENHFKVLNGYVVDHRIVSPLHEGGINIAIGKESGRSQSGRKSNRVLFRYAHIKAPFRHFLHHNVQGASAGHGRSNANNGGIGPGQFKEGVTKNILEADLFGGVGFFVCDPQTGLGIEQSWSMPGGLVLFCRGEPLSLNGQNVQQPGTFEVFQSS